MDLQLSVQSVHITNKVVSSNPAHGEEYLIQHYVIKFDSDLRSQIDYKLYNCTAYFYRPPLTKKKKKYYVMYMMYIIFYNIKYIYQHHVVVIT